MENSYLIETHDLVKTYPLGGYTIKALDRVNLTFEKAEFTGLVGPSRSGKTTLLSITALGLTNVREPGHGPKEELSHKQAAALQPSHRFHFRTFAPPGLYGFENVEFPLLGLFLGERRKMTDALSGRWPTFWISR
jgi:putative ABC transport system ATP-binding protein